MDSRKILRNENYNKYDNHLNKLGTEKIPNLNHSLFNGVNNLELRTPKIKKIIDKLNAHNLKSSPYFGCHKATIKNTTKNTNLKLRFDEICILVFDVIIN